MSDETLKTRTWAASAPDSSSLHLPHSGLNLPLLQKFRPHAMHGLSFPSLSADWAASSVMPIRFGSPNLLAAIWIALSVRPVMLPISSTDSIGRRFQRSQSSWGDVRRNSVSGLRLRTLSGAADEA